MDARRTGRKLEPPHSMYYGGGLVAKSLFGSRMRVLYLGRVWLESAHFLNASKSVRFVFLMRALGP